MKWPLSILVGNQFVGYLDCKMDWRIKKFILKEIYLTLILRITRGLMLRLRN